MALEAYQFQASSVESVKRLPYSAIFHEQGTGKTKIAIDLLLYWLDHDEIDTVFIVTKKALISNWLQELEAHSFLTPAVLGSNRSENALRLNTSILVYVLNYEILPSNLETLSLFFKTCRVAAILDESHKIKNPEAKLSKAFHSISELLERKVIMSGTTSNSISSSIGHQTDFHLNPFSDAIDLFGNTGGSLSSGTYTVPMRNADGMYLDSSDNELYVIVRYAGNPTPIDDITLTFS